MGRFRLVVQETHPRTKAEADQERQNLDALRRERERVADFERQDKAKALLSRLFGPRKGPEAEAADSNDPSRPTTPPPPPPSAFGPTVKRASTAQQRSPGRRSSVLTSMSVEAERAEERQAKDEKHLALRHMLLRYQGEKMAALKAPGARRALKAAVSASTLHSADGRPASARPAPALEEEDSSGFAVKTVDRIISMLQNPLLEMNMGKDVTSKQVDRESDNRKTSRLLLNMVKGGEEALCRVKAGAWYLEAVECPDITQSEANLEAESLKRVGEVIVPPRPTLLTSPSMLSRANSQISRASSLRRTSTATNRIPEPEPLPPRPTAPSRPQTAAGVERAARTAPYRKVVQRDIKPFLDLEIAKLEVMGKGEKAEQTVRNLQRELRIASVLKRAEAEQAKLNLPQTLDMKLKPSLLPQEEETLRKRQRRAARQTQHESKKSAMSRLTSGRPASARTTTSPTGARGSRVSFSTIPPTGAGAGAAGGSPSGAAARVSGAAGQAAAPGGVALATQSMTAATSAATSVAAVPVGQGSTSGQAAANPLASQLSVASGDFDMGLQTVSMGGAGSPGSGSPARVSGRGPLARSSFNGGLSALLSSVITPGGSPGPGMAPPTYFSDSESDLAAHDAAEARRRHVSFFSETAAWENSLRPQNLEKNKVTQRHELTKAQLKKKDAEVKEKKRPATDRVSVAVPSVEDMLISLNAALSHLSEDLSKELKAKRLRRARDYRLLVRGVNQIEATEGPVPRPWLEKRLELDRLRHFERLVWTEDARARIEKATWVKTLLKQIEDHARKGNLQPGERIIAKDVMECYMDGRHYTQKDFMGMVLKLSREDHYTSEVQDALFSVMEALGINEEELDELYKEAFGKVGAYDAMRAYRWRRNQVTMAKRSDVLKDLGSRWKAVAYEKTVRRTSALSPLNAMAPPQRSHEDQSAQESQGQVASAIGVRDRRGGVPGMLSATSFKRLAVVAGVKAAHLTLPDNLEAAAAAAAVVHGGHDMDEADATGTPRSPKTPKVNPLGTSTAPASAAVSGDSFQGFDVAGTVTRSAASRRRMAYIFQQAGAAADGEGAGAPETDDRAASASEASPSGAFFGVGKKASRLAMAAVMQSLASPEDAAGGAAQAPSAKRQSSQGPGQEVRPDKSFVFSSAAPAPHSASDDLATPMNIGRRPDRAPLPWQGPPEAVKRVSIAPTAASAAPHEPGDGAQARVSHDSRERHSHQSHRASENSDADRAAGDTAYRDSPISSRPSSRLGRNIRFAEENELEVDLVSARPAGPAPPSRSGSRRTGWTQAQGTNPPLSIRASSSKKMQLDGASNRALGLGGAGDAPIIFTASRGKPSPSSSFLLARTAAALGTTAGSGSSKAP